MSNRLPHWVHAALAVTFAFLSRTGGARAEAPGVISGVQGYVNVAREAPFDNWCVKPACPEPSTAAILRTLPAVLVPVVEQSFMEQRLRHALAEALKNAENAALGEQALPAPLLDLAETAAAAAALDSAALNRLGGLGASALRVSLVYELDRALPRTAQCRGPERLDALYEGLALSASFGALRFPRKTGRVARNCVAVAQHAARDVDSAVLRAVAPPTASQNLAATLAALSAVRANCAAPIFTVKGLSSSSQALDEAVRATSLAATLRALARLHTPARMESETETPPVVVPACDSAVKALQALDAASLEELLNLGLGGGSIDAIVQSLQEPLLPGDNPLARERYERMLRVLVRLALGKGTDIDLRALVRDLAASVDDSSLPGASWVLRGAISALEPAVIMRDDMPTIDPSLLVAAYVQKYDLDSAGAPVLRALLGPSPWVFEVNGGIPQVDFGSGKIVGDLSFGYAKHGFGIVGRGAVDRYDLSTTSLQADYAHYQAGLEVYWLSGGPKAGWRAEISLAGSFDYYDTTSYPIPVEIGRFVDFDSRIARGHALVGIRFQSAEGRVAAGAHVGGGFQYEDPDTTTLSGATLAFQSEANLSAQASARALVRWRVVPSVVGLRLRGDGLYFKISRSQLRFDGTATTISNQEQSQLELRARLFVDLDIAALLGLVPAVWAGLDSLHDSGGAANNALLTAVLGLGITLRQ